MPIRKVNSHEVAHKNSLRKTKSSGTDRRMQELSKNISGAASGSNAAISLSNRVSQAKDLSERTIAQTGNPFDIAVSITDSKRARRLEKERVREEAESKLHVIIPISYPSSNQRMTAVFENTHK